MYDKNGMQVNNQRRNIYIYLCVCVCVVCIYIYIYIYIYRERERDQMQVSQLQRRNAVYKKCPLNCITKIKWIFIFKTNVLYTIDNLPVRRMITRLQEMKYRVISMYRTIELL